MHVQRACRLAGLPDANKKCKMVFSEAGSKQEIRLVGLRYSVSEDRKSKIEESELVRERLAKEIGVVAILVEIACRYPQVTTE